MDMEAHELSAIAARLTESLGRVGKAGEHDDPIVTLVYDTPVGPMVGGATADGLCLLEFVDRRALDAEVRDLIDHLDRGLAAEATAAPGRRWLDQMAGELAAYFSGELRRFETRLHMPGTPFERAVWEELLRIPYGQTRSYGQMAEQLGKPGASRAVGRANGRNRMAIVVPCHRVIEANGKLRGYGGGLERKQFLLEHERAVAGESLFAGALSS